MDPTATAITIDALGPWAGTAALAWAAQTLHGLARSAATIAAELSAIRRGLGLGLGAADDAPSGAPLTVTIGRATA